MTKKVKKVKVKKVKKPRKEAFKLTEDELFIVNEFFDKIGYSSTYIERIMNLRKKLFKSDELRDNIIRVETIYEAVKAYLIVDDYDSETLFIVDQKTENIMTLDDTIEECKKYEESLVCPAIRFRNVSNVPKISIEKLTITNEGPEIKMDLDFKISVFTKQYDELHALYSEAVSNNEDTIYYKTRKIKLSTAKTKLSGIKSDIDKLKLQESKIDYALGVKFEKVKVFN